ncbi:MULTISPECIES: hypothetical protein [Frankia]|uniref:Uncharacterized protein n=1 Tax=Frankia alni (strain DSM 45986 / CECT 9034 / ACN14a) TaxID=326424 RepID=Q0RFK9_FRAAA|nr:MULTISPECIES: hypothetical protein [Frankia]CAJ63734.1 hypothetical protein FRAAL5094 [Frankia alni ACN14a]
MADHLGSIPREHRQQPAQRARRAGPPLSCAARAASRPRSAGGHTGVGPRARAGTDITGTDITGTNAAGPGTAGPDTADAEPAGRGPDTTGDVGDGFPQAATRLGAGQAPQSIDEKGRLDCERPGRWRPVRAATRGGIAARGGIVEGRVDRDGRHARTH